MTDGEVFAEACLFGVSPYPANAEAIEDSEVYMIKNSDLEKMLESSPKAAGDGVVLKTNLSRQDMGNMVGLTRETLTRALTRLKNDRAISIDRDEIKVLDLEKLKSWIY